MLWRRTGVRQMILSIKRRSRINLQLHQPQEPHQPLNDEPEYALQEEHEPKPERELPQLPQFEFESPYREL